jgi:hypothetical protein
MAVGHTMSKEAARLMAVEPECGAQSCNESWYTLCCCWCAGAAAVAGAVTVLLC